MSIDTASIINHFGERMQRLAIYEPLYVLKRKQKKDEKEQPIPYYELGMLTLLFFFENMIMRQKNCGTKELAAFLYDTTQKRIALKEESFEDLAREIIDVFRPPNGKRSSMSFYDWEKGQEENVYYSILKAAKSDLTTNTQYYALDESGLEIIFSSREYFSEFQISISQLLLRKQLEKGEFTGALRQIDEMSLAVETLRERLIKIKREVARSIVSEETYERYKNLIEDINSRLSRENEEFDELQDFVKQTKDSLRYKVEDEKDRKAYELILKVDRGLENVHSEHGMLLQESIELRTKALEAAQQALYFIGIDSFNFAQDITGHLLGTPLPIEASKILFQPFSEIQRTREWYPLSVFGRQRIEKGEDKEKRKAFLESADEEMLNKDRAVVSKYFKEIMTHTVKLLDGRSCMTLEELIEAFVATEKTMHYLEERLFYDFWIILHQKSPIDLKEIEPDSLLSGVKEALEGVTNKINVTEAEANANANVEQEGLLQKVPRFVIKNMKIDLTLKRKIEEGEKDGL